MHKMPNTQPQSHKFKSMQTGGGSPTLNAAELYTLKWLILCYVNFASIKFFKHEKDCILTLSIYTM